MHTQHVILLNVRGVLCINSPTSDPHNAFLQKTEGHDLTSVASVFKAQEPSNRRRHKESGGVPVGTA